MGDIETILVETIPPHPAADGIADELLDDNVVMPDDLVVDDADFTLLEDGYFIHRDIRLEFVL